MGEYCTFLLCFPPRRPARPPHWPHQVGLQCGTLGLLLLRGSLVSTQGADTLEERLLAHRLSRLLEAPAGLSSTRARPVSGCADDALGGARLRPMTLAMYVFARTRCILCIEGRGTAECDTTTPLMMARGSFQTALVRARFSGASVGPATRSEWRRGGASRGAMGATSTVRGATDCTRAPSPLAWTGAVIPRSEPLPLTSRPRPAAVSCPSWAFDRASRESP